MEQRITNNLVAIFCWFQSIGATVFDINAVFEETITHSIVSRPYTCVNTIAIYRVLPLPIAENKRVCIPVATTTGKKR